jgi:hypothetical protein
MNFIPMVEVFKEDHSMQRINFPTRWSDRKYQCSNQVRLEKNPCKDQKVTIFTNMLMLLVIFRCHILLRVDMPLCTT